MLLVTASIVLNNRVRYNCFLLKGFIAPFTTSCYNKSMNKNLKITYFKPTKQGVYPIKNGFSFAEEVLDDGNSGLILYAENGEQKKIPFQKEGKRGSLCGVMVEAVSGEFPYTEYNYYHKNTVYTDAFARKVNGLSKFGHGLTAKRKTRGSLTYREFDWGEDEPLLIPYSNSVIYGLNVRAFTMHKSSHVKNRGTYEGIAEKASYLNGLGITAVELMPCYEYDECIYPSSGAVSDKPVKEEIAREVKNLPEAFKEKVRLNCWGYQEGFYFAPKASYSAGGDPEVSFKNMVKELHANGIEVMMQFYFPPEMNQSVILDILKYWVIEYHIDGVRLSGFQIPYLIIAKEPVLQETKIRSSYFPLEEIYGDKIPYYRNLAADNGNYRNDMRRFLKGDENLVGQVIFDQRNNPRDCAVVNYLADYDGFSLYDMVSYDRKHNEANGEYNRDGTDHNYSWNCGFEGECRKKSVLDLRKKQIKNALAFLFLSQGVPYLFSGDEFGNTRYGNNNAYCQDNDTGYIKWKTGKLQDEILGFTKALIRFRKEHSILHSQKELKILDTLGCGYPDISYHGTEAWRPDLSYISRMIGIMLCGNYAEKQDEPSIYIAYNMHWIEHELALPKLPKGEKFVPVLWSEEIMRPVSDDSVGKNEAAEKEDSSGKKAENKIVIPGRSIAVYVSQKENV